MPRCIDCARFPWVTGADLSMLPAVKCHPDMPARRFTEEAAGLEWECRYFARNNEAPVEAVEEQPPAGQVAGNLDPEYLAGLKVDEMKRLAADMGVTVPDRATKKQLVELIAAKQVVAEETEEADTGGAQESDGTVEVAEGAGGRE